MNERVNGLRDSP